VTLVKWARRLQGRFTGVISPYAKDNYVDHRITDQSSILRFIEENWELAAWAMVPQTQQRGR
jgi:phospholipase C